MNKIIAANLLQTHQEELLRFIVRRVNCRETARDILQDCFIRFADYLEQKTVQNPRAFLFRMAANQSTDYLRQHQTRLIERDSDLSELVDLADPAPLPDEAVYGAERLAKLKQALEQLQPEYRQVFVLRNIKHLSYQEITEITGLSYNTIFKYIQKALLHCQRHLEEE